MEFIFVVVIFAVPFGAIGDCFGGGGLLLRHCRRRLKKARVCVCVCVCACEGGWVVNNVTVYCLGRSIYPTAADDESEEGHRYQNQTSRQTVYCQHNFVGALQTNKLFF